MLSDIIAYLVLGLMFGITMEFLNTFYLNYQEHWKWYDRVILVVLWPILLVIFLISFIKGMLGL